MLVGTRTESVREFGEPGLVYDDLIDFIDVNDQAPY
jgi:hypothetical protein